MLKRVITYIVLFVSVVSFSQTDKQKQLEAQKAQIQRQIANFRDLLRSEQNKEKSVLEQLEEQRTKIRLTEALIKTTKEQENLLQRAISSNEKQINLLTKELEELKADYAQMIVKSYETGSEQSRAIDRKSTRLNSSHVRISYAVFCLKKKNK